MDNKLLAALAVLSVVVFAVKYVMAEIASIIELWRTLVGRRRK